MFSKALTEDLTEKNANLSRKAKFLIFSVPLATGLIYYFSNPNPQVHFDYTLRVAENFILLQKIAIWQAPPSWLSEMIPFEGRWFSAFPLGSVLTMLPVAVLKSIGLFNENPSGFLGAFAASLFCLFLLLISTHYEYGWGKRILLVSGILFGTWMWTNLMMAGAWQLALGFAIAGEAGAIYFSLFNRKPLVAGFFFALAFGNRTEILLMTPLFLYLLIHERPESSDYQNADLPEERKKEKFNTYLLQRNHLTAALFFREWKRLALFCAAPFCLGILTLVYNYLRFHSFMDFGYSRIPGVLDEPWYRYGIFSFSYIQLNVKEMLLTLWIWLPDYPYLVPTGFGGAIWLGSPFLFFLFRWKVKDRILFSIAWTAIVVLTFFLWTHGNPGGWQFSYRYSMVLLPWIFLILLENSPRKITIFEILAFGASFAVNAYATYLFFWTDYIKP